MFFKMPLANQLWRSRVGTFNSALCILTKPSRIKLLHKAFLTLCILLYLFVKFCLTRIRSYLCFIIFYIFLIIWCLHFCVIHRILIFLFKLCFSNHFAMFLYINLWWISKLIVFFLSWLEKSRTEVCIFHLSSLSNKYPSLESKFVTRP